MGVISRSISFIWNGRPSPCAAIYLIKKMREKKCGDSYPPPFRWAYTSHIAIMEIACKRRKGDAPMFFLAHAKAHQLRAPLRSARLIGVTLPNTQRVPFSALSQETSGGAQFCWPKIVHKRRLLRLSRPCRRTVHINRRGQSAKRSRPEHDRAIFAGYLRTQFRRQFHQGAAMKGRNP